MIKLYIFFKLLQSSFLNMKSEILEKTANQYFNEIDCLYMKDKELVRASGIEKIIGKCIEEKKIKDFSISTQVPMERIGEDIKYTGKYFIEIIWGEKKTMNGDSFCNAVLIFPQSKENKIVISSSEDIVIKKEKFGRKDLMREKLLEAFENPIQRSKTPFYDSQVKENSFF